MNITSIQVLGGGCKNCETLLANTKEVLTTVGLDIEPEYITDFTQIALLGIMRTPALTINGKVVSQGKVCKTDEIKKYVTAALNE